MALKMFHRYGNEKLCVHDGQSAGDFVLQKIVQCPYDQVVKVKAFVKFEKRTDVIIKKNNDSKLFEIG